MSDDIRLTWELKDSVQKKKHSFTEIGEQFQKLDNIYYEADGSDTVDSI